MYAIGFIFTLFSMIV